MASANRKEVFHSDMETVWEAVTSLEDYAWRSDLDRIEILEPENPGSASAKNPIHTGMKFWMKPFVGIYLRNQQKQYMEDLRKKLEG